MTIACVLGLGKMPFLRDKLTSFVHKIVHSMTNILFSFRNDILLDICLIGDVLLLQSKVLYE